MLNSDKISSDRFEQAVTPSAPPITPVLDKTDPGFLFMNGNGFVKVYRKIMDNPGYFSEQFCRNMAWVDLIMLANYTDGFFRIRGVRVDVTRGQVGYAVETLGSRWKWSRGKVERFLTELEEDKQIVRQKTNVTTLITILNYEYYQGDGKANDNANSKTNGHQTASLIFISCQPVASSSGGQESGFIIRADYQNGSAWAKASITVDATNINLTWTKTSAPTGTIQILWQVQA